MKKFIIPATLIFLFLCTGKTVYCIDAESGNDSNSGNSLKLAWQSLKKVNQTEFKSGCKILFKAGNSWSGQLEPKGIGTDEAPIQINRYGEGENPAIHENREELHTLLLHNVEYWEVRNLEITNTGEERVAGRRGVIVRAEDFGDCHHIVLDSLEIHHVNGSLVKSDGALIEYNVMRDCPDILSHQEAAAYPPPVRIGREKWEQLMSNRTV